MIKQKSIVIPVIVVALIILGGAGFAIYKHRFGASDSSTNPRGVNTVDYGGPTDAEKSVGNDQKAKNVARDELNNTPSSSSRVANLVIVDSSQYDNVFEVRAYVSNVFEDGGTCTVTLSKSGSTTVTKSGSALSSATTTQCSTIDIPISDFSTKGQWQLEVSYQSSTASGTSGAREITIK